jgi:hypothetical protein
MDAMDRSPQLAGQPGLAHQPSTCVSDQFYPLEKLVDLPFPVKGIAHHNKTSFKSLHLWEQRDHNFNIDVKEDISSQIPS